jgi:hypothetical protein
MTIAKHQRSFKHCVGGCLWICALWLQAKAAVLAYGHQRPQSRCSAAFGDDGRFVCRGLAVGKRCRRPALRDSATAVQNTLARLRVRIGDWRFQISKETGPGQRTGDWKVACIPQSRDWKACPTSAIE